MCGIAGIVAVNNAPAIDESVIRAMTDRMRHRGPDDSGAQVVAGPAGSGKCAGLGHRRLSIIDLSPLGHQPMANEDRTVWVTFNGEIYNYKPLREDLIGKGHRFVSGSDTEVLVHGWEEYREKICEKITGMFAFAIWDARDGTLLLARDRFGKKPLYFRNTPQGLSFASELKCFPAIPGFSPQLDYKSLSRYLAYEYVPAPHSIYKGVNKLMPGSYLLYTGREPVIKKYWDISFENDAWPKMSFADAEHTLLDLLKKSVEKRLMSDVALGAFLSGGIDSSAVVALMTEIIDSRLVKTFSIGFEDKSFDESGWARMAARHFNTDHHEKTFTVSDMFSILPKVWDFLDEPFADASVLPTYMLSEFTRQTVTVALGGDGGDELFAGYDPFLAHRLANAYSSCVPRWFTNAVVSPLVSALPVSTKNMSLDFRMKQFLKGMAYPLSVRNQAWLGAFPQFQQEQVLSREVLESINGFDVYEDITQAREGRRRFRDWVDEITFMYEHFYMGEDILTKVDRASMAVSLEVRTPFLDQDFSEFANSLPSRFKLHGLTRKFILKKALEKKLPREIIYRRKKGFGIPLTKWLRDDLRPVLLDLFSEDRMKKEGLFNISYVKTLMNEHFEGRRDNRKQLWTLLMFEQWRQRYCS
jgi:asparagine synthase (glutamine-hydrolysing)